MQNNHTIRRLCGLVLAIAPWLFMLWGVFEHGIIIGIATLAKDWRNTGLERLKKEKRDIGYGFSASVSFRRSIAIL